MTEETITFTPSASLRKGLKLIAKGIWLTIGSIGKARAERDRLNKQNYELNQKIEKLSYGTYHGKRL